MKYILIFSVFILAAFPALADDVFLKPNEEAAQSTAQKNISQQAQAQNTDAAQIPPTQKAFAEAYFQNCMTQQTDMLSPDSQELLCACSSANLQAGKMSVAEISLMQDNSAQGQRMRNKMLTEIYAPCIEYPTHDLILKNCLSDPKVEAVTGNGSKICGCMAGKVSRHLAANAQDIIRAELAKNPNNMDPLGIFLNSAAYEQEAQKALMACIL